MPALPSCSFVTIFYEKNDIFLKWALPNKENIKRFFMKNENAHFSFLEASLFK